MAEDAAVDDDEIGDEIDDDIAEDDTAEDGTDDTDGNRRDGSIPRNVLEYLARQIVDDPDSVVVEASEAPGRVDLRLNVAPDDMGMVIGRRGRMASAIRTVVRAAGAREGVEASVDIVD
ncbi:MAG: KH domain-containing protein [Acidimicrobiales bacterium]